ncbi:hypothetical protein FBY06_11836 [Pseudomonas sp. SJZ085]|uniref:DUF7167 family protein n=1 Tax=unclassified Pseudomonas TaxID=196821 RepID=UPI00119BAE77|nr:MULTISPECIES: hypothetical protein [unclassified Pseudomonas]TWC17116.1 hypothetical protein FBX99_118108 [Pseudomonas sp. SJZ074]TWC35130.1 hypothetical protein FBY06_11836 [Pseudomonas sp. SJZ085]
MSDKIKIKLFVGTGFAGCAHRDEEFVDRAEWEAMSEQQREQYLDDAATDYLHNCVEYSAWVEEEDDEE